MWAPETAMTLSWSVLLAKSKAVIFFSFILLLLSSFGCLAIENGILMNVSFHPLWVWTFVRFEWCDDENRMGVHPFCDDKASQQILAFGEQFTYETGKQEPSKE
jgi:hypothetical protein